MKKLFLILLLAMILAFMTVGFTAYAEGETVVVSEELSLEDLFAKWGLPIVGGTTGGLMLLVIAFLKPYIKTVGENKTVKALYKSTKELLDISQSDNELLKKYQLENSPTVIAEKIKQEFFSEIEKVVEEKLLSLFNKDKELSACTLSNTEVISEQINALTKAASIVWANQDGVLPTLSASPKTQVLEKQSKEIQYLKTFVAEKLEMETKEIQAMLDKAVNNG